MECLIEAGHRAPTIRDYCPEMVGRPGDQAAPKLAGIDSASRTDELRRSEVSVGRRRAPFKPAVGGRTVRVYAGVQGGRIAGNSGSGLSRDRRQNQITVHVD